MVRTGGEGPAGISTLVIEKDTPGLSFGANEKKMGWNAQPTAAGDFRGARVPVANRLGPEGIGFKIAMAGLDGGRLNIAACSLGGAQAALDKALAYAGERKAFGAAHRRFPGPAVPSRRHGDGAGGGAHLPVARRLRARRQGARAGQLCAMAKRFGTDAASRSPTRRCSCIGGYGYLADYGIEKIVRDLRVHQILEGTNEIMRVIIARALIGRGQGSGL